MRGLHLLLFFFLVTGLSCVLVTMASVRCATVASCAHAPLTPLHNSPLARYVINNPGALLTYQLKKSDVRAQLSRRDARCMPLKHF